MRKQLARLAQPALIPAILLLAALACVPSFLPCANAQINSQSYPQKFFWASDYGVWSIRGQQANTFSWSPIGICQVAAPGGGTYVPFATNAPVWIQDATAANSEVLTPTAVTITGGGCGITVSPVNQHYSFQVVSGTGGLQEVINQISASNSYPALVWLDRNWYTAANSVPGTNAYSIIHAAAGNSAIRLVDNTTTPFQYYAWNGTNYVVIGSLTGGASAPTAAAGAAAGTSPTGPTNTDVSGGNVYNVALTTGTATTTGTLFTETYATSNAFTFEPACTVTSTGSNSFTTFTTAVTYPSGTHALLTITATGAPVASTAYAFHVSCQ